ncbi:MAG: glycosyl hydrolase family 8, partial [Ramlibacter sp.]
RLVPYVAGIKPTQSNATMDAQLASQYDAWKAARAVSASSVVSGGYAVQFSDANYLTVSEGMGYGMLITVLFAGHDAQAQAIFNGMLAVVRARPAYAMTPYNASGQYLMDWRLNANGTSAGQGWNAMDGDLDIAMALLMADKQWGSAGAVNYLQEAKNTIAGLKYFNFKPDGTTKGLSTANVSRTSDYMIGHFRAFKAATGDTLWDLAVDRAYNLLDRMQTVYSPGKGLMPDFIVATDTTTPYPSPGYMGDGNNMEGYYYWNGCRNPWRLGTDYVLSGDTRFATVCGRLMDFFQSASGGNAANIASGYKLDGTVLGAYADSSFIGPAAVGAMVDTRFQSMLDSAWNWNIAHPTTGYYDSEIQLLSMVVASGNWWTPGTGTPTGTGSTSTTNTTNTTTTVTGTSVLVNGDFSNGLTGWNNWGNSVAASGAVQVGTAAGGIAQDIASKLTPGTKYQLTGTALITLAAEGIYVGVKLMDAAGTVLVNQSQLVSSLTAANLSVSFTAPQGAASGFVYIWKNADSALGYVDNLSLVAVA